MGELEPTELVFAMLISDLAAVPMQDFGIPLLFGLIPIVTLLAITMALSVLSLKSIRFRDLICGRPSVIMDHGSILQDALAKNRFTVDELLEELRLQGITDLSTPSSMLFWRTPAGSPSSSTRLTSRPRLTN